MPQLYTVSFTTKSMVKKFDAKGKIIAETALDKPVTITALPYATAMSYAQADNFKIENYDLAEGRRKLTPKGTGRDNSVGSGLKTTRTVTGMKVGKKIEVAPKVGAGHSPIAEAAMTGNLAAAINA